MKKFTLHTHSQLVSLVVKIVDTTSTEAAGSSPSECTKENKKGNRECVTWCRAEEEGKRCTEE